MHRYPLDDLQTWKDRPGRKPLVIRGARQVGKTTLVRLFAQRSFAQLAELNFERRPEDASLFASKDPKQILQLLELRLGSDIVPGQTLLFLDEIQAAPEVLATLRYFFEDLPEMHVIAAGSLLDLALEEPAFSVPVGRIEYLHLGPMQFGEFLLATGQDKLASFLGELSIDQDIPEAVHLQLLAELKRFLVIGGMPDAVRAWVEDGSHRASEQIKHSILATFRDDFGKYGSRVSPARLRKVFERLPHLVGGKLKYVQIDRDERAKDLAAALHLLTLARVAYRVRHSAANGIPLGAEADERKVKILFLDVGLMTTALGLTMLDLESVDDPLTLDRGSLCEQLVGQHLLYGAPSWEEPQLYYWAREERSSSAEIDYVMSQGREILPIEVKAGKTGTLKSLHLFLHQKKRRLAIRLSTAPLSVVTATTSLPGDDNVPFTLLSLPLYLVGEVRRLARELIELPTPPTNSTLSP